MENQNQVVLDMVSKVPGNQTLQSAIVKCSEILPQYHNIKVSVSGGADSDIVVDMVTKIGKLDDIKFVWFNTGLEFQATKDHLDFLENKYGIRIERILPEKSIVMACREYGVPFVNKYASEMLYKLQAHGFQFEDEPLELLEKKYSGCRKALRWWCNDFGDDSFFNIGRNNYLKEFLIENPPTFPISNKCCHYAKKKTFSDYVKNNQCDLDISGIRKSEGGVRSLAYKDCFSDDVDGVPQYRPLFWIQSADRTAYNDAFGIEHSKCYTEYGMKRTGCGGCPFNRQFLRELDILKEYEPTLYKACWNVFGDSYRHMILYRKFQEEMYKKRQ